MESTPSTRSRDARVVFSERSHPSGVTVRLDTGRSEEGVVSLELYPVEGDGAHPVRTAAIARHPRADHCHGGRFQDRHERDLPR